MYYDFKKELEEELEKLIFLYDFCYFNNAIIKEELASLCTLIRTHREVIMSLE